MDTHPSIGVYSKCTEIYDPESTLSFSGLEICSISGYASLSEHGGDILPLSRSILVGMQTAFPSNFTSDRHNGHNAATGLLKV